MIIIQERTNSSLLDQRKWDRQGRLKKKRKEPQRKISRRKDKDEERARWERCGGVNKREKSSWGKGT